MFKASSAGAALTRTFTHSKYDHVAMILRMEGNLGEVFIIDATGNNGVAICTWSSLRDHIGSNKYYRKVIYRHVDFNRSKQMVKKLDQFLSEVVGKKYDIGPKKLLRKKSESEFLAIK